MFALPLLLILGTPAGAQLEFQVESERQYLVQIEDQAERKECPSALRRNYSCMLNVAPGKIDIHVQEGGRDVAYRVFQIPEGRHTVTVAPVHSTGASLAWAAAGLLGVLGGTLTGLGLFTEDDNFLFAAAPTLFLAVSSFIAGYIFGYEAVVDVDGGVQL